MKKEREKKQQERVNSASQIKKSVMLARLHDGKSETSETKYRHRVEITLAVFREKKHNEELRKFGLRHAERNEIQSDKAVMSTKASQLD